MNNKHNSSDLIENEENKRETSINSLRKMGMNIISSEHQLESQRRKKGIF